MTNDQFCNVLYNSFLKFLATGSRSNAKLKILHSKIAADLGNRLGSDFEVAALGLNNGREGTIIGRYVDKKVDILISKNGAPVAGMAIKFVMQNYMRNSNNYFENMLGETANIRSNHIPYYQIFVIPDRIPYYEKDGSISRWEEINQHNLDKYNILSNDDTETYMHTPDKTLLCVVHISDSSTAINNRNEYISYYKNNSFSISLSTRAFDSFGRNVIYNDYTLFIEKVFHSILSQ
ncbi:MAG: hypothetical protein SOZ00_02640 [Tidjanibacter sp.]|nr:hypothetical protein [Tidjanibacter sp.]